MSNTRTAVIVGATGLVGQELLKLLIASEKYEKITVLVRREFAVKHPKIITQIIDFEQIMESKFEADDAFCCLGTTLKKAGSKTNFYRVDFTYVHHFAKISAQNGAKQFLMISSMGADKNSVFYYNQVKGAIENAVQQFDFQYFVKIFRPSLLLGERSEKRMGEDIGKMVFNLFSPVIPAKYKGVQARQVAKMMYEIALENRKQFAIFESDIIQQY